MDTTVDRSVSAVDRFLHVFFGNPYPHHGAMREAGPVVRLERHGIWAMAEKPERHLNTTLRALDSLPLRITPA
jgi:hypothetical protein